jgi:hypothetical protein
MTKKEQMQARLMAGADVQGSSPWTIFGPASYVEGEVDEAMGELTDVFIRLGYRLFIRTDKDAIEISEPKVLYDVLDFYEKENGVGALVRLLLDGVTIDAGKDGERESGFRIGVCLDGPPSAEDRDKFIDMVEEWVSDNDLPYVDRFFRRPTLSQDPVDRYLDNPLESCFKHMFGFAFQYQVSISCKGPVCSDLELKDRLKKALGNH